MTEPIRPPKDKAELVSMLAPRGLSYGKMWGGRADLTREDVAGALGAGRHSAAGGLSDLQKYLALAVIAGDENTHSALIDHGTAFAWRVVSDRRWRVTAQRQVHGIAVRALAELAGNNRCTDCRGTGKVPNERGVRVDCMTCNATGRGVVHVECYKCEGQGWRLGEETDCTVCDPHGRVFIPRHGGGSLCARCNGTKRYVPTLYCRACGGTARGHGTGMRPITGRQMATLLGISHTAWQNTWSGRLDVMVSLLEQELAAVDSHIRRQLREPDRLAKGVC